MGLNIIAVNKIKKVADFYEKIENIKIEDEKKLIRVKVNAFFSSHDNLESGIYVYEGDEIEFSGPYSEYSAFRNILANIAHSVNCAEIWANCDIYKNGAFYELIDFSDCEGVIGPISASKLLLDFKKYREDFYKISNKWDCENYENWIIALDIASSDGMIIFC